MARITQIPKNSREEFRVSRKDFQGYDLINIRVFFVSKDGEMLAGKQGVVFKAELLPDFIDALSKAEVTQMGRHEALNTQSGCVPVEEMSRLHSLGHSLLPLVGGINGKSPLLSLANPSRLPLKRVLGPMYGKGSSCFGVRLDGLAVVDCDEHSQSLVKDMEARFGASSVHVSTPRGVHLYFRDVGGQAPRLRDEGYPVDVKRGSSSYVVGLHSIRPDGGTYQPLAGILGVNHLPAILLETGATQFRTEAITIGTNNTKTYSMRSILCLPGSV